MYADSRIRSGLEAMLHQIEVPSVPLLNIQQRMLRPRALTRRSKGSYLRSAAAAAVAVIAVSFPIVAPSVVQSVRERIAEILQWTPPPVQPPRWLTSGFKHQTTTLAVAQTIVPFRIVPPAGLPGDVTSLTIETSTTGLYVKATRSWEKGTPAVFFNYQRSHGRSFSLLADRFDPREGPQGEYMFLDTGKMRDGIPVVIRFQKFIWRNGDQVMSVVADGISAGEIAAIRTAMHGTVVPPAQTRAEADSGTVSKMYPAGP
jgi:hypothetical protein